MTPRYDTDKISYHGYDKIYLPMFSTIAVDSVLEIGVLKGESLKMWKGLFPSAQVTGVDISLTRDARGVPGVRLIQADFTDYREVYRVRSLLPDQSIIIDDGPHDMASQQTSLGILFSRVRPGGMYVVEGLHTSLEVDNKSKYGILQNFDNTTLSMLRGLAEGKKPGSIYINDSDMNSLIRDLESITLYYANRGGSISALLKKKECAS